MPLPNGYVPLCVPLEPADAQVGRTCGPDRVGSRSFWVENDHPVTENMVEGWKWDEKEGVDDSNSTFNSTIPSIFDTLTSGITKSYFQSGIGSGKDLEHLFTEVVTVSGIGGAGYIPDGWIAQVQHGTFFDLDTPWYLYSDDSEMELVSASSVIGGISQNLSQVVLQFTPKLGIPISVRQFTWNSAEQSYTPATVFRQKVYFTGIKLGDMRLSTWAEPREEINFHNIDDTDPEFVVTYSGGVPQLIFNTQLSQQVGDAVTVSGLELLGYSTGNYLQQFHTQYAPIDPTSTVRVFTWLNPVLDVVEWMPQSGLAYPLEGYEVGIDYELGLVEFPSISGNPIPAGHSVGITYFRTFAVEYEPQDSIDTATAFEANLNPVRRHEEQGFFYLTTDSEQVTAISLSALLPYIGTNLYGPLYLGNNFATLVASVTDEDGEVVEGAEIHFQVTSTPAVGGFGVSQSTSSISDADGFAHAFYNPPSTIQGLSKEVGVADITVGAGTVTLSLADFPLDGTAEDIFLFQVYTDDVLLGYRNPLLASDPNTQLNDYYMNFFTEHGIWGNIGLAAPGVLATQARSWEELRRAVWGLSTPDVYEAAAGKGKKLLVATESVDALDPHVFTSPAVSPFQPTTVTEVPGGYTLTYDTSAYAFVLPSGYLACYLVVAPVRVSIQAYYVNPITGRRVESNIIEIRVAIPPSMNGLWIVETLNGVSVAEISAILAAMDPTSVVGKRIPLGFRIKSDNVTLASALGGVVFLDMNRLYNQDAWTPCRIKFKVEIP